MSQKKIHNMSGHGFHVHGPHDHEIEHAAQQGAKDSFAGRTAVITAVLASLGIVLGGLAAAHI